MTALEPGIDLLEALNLHSNHSRYIGVTLTQGFKMKMAYHLIGELDLRRQTCFFQIEQGIVFDAFSLPTLPYPQFLLNLSGFASTICSFLGDEKRNLIIPPPAYRHAVELIRRSSEFTFSATIRQEESNSGTIISFSHGNLR